MFSVIDPKNVSFIFAGVWTILTDQPLEKCSLHYLLETCKNVSYMFSTVSSPKCKLHFRRSPPSKGVGIIVQSSADAEGRLFRIPGTYRCWKVRIFWASNFWRRAGNECGALRDLEGFLNNSGGCRVWMVRDLVYPAGVRNCGCSWKRLRGIWKARTFPRLPERCWII